MAKIALKPFVMRDVLLKINTTDAVPVDVGDFEAHASQVQFDPNTPTVTFKGLANNSATFTGAATWTVTIALAQDWETPGSLSRYLHEHEGETIDVDFEPVRGGTAVNARVIVAPGSIGGGVDAVAASTVTLAVDGKPTIAAA